MSMKGTIKRKLAALLCLCILVQFFTVSALAAPQAPEIVVSSGSVTTGGTVTVSVSGKNLVDLASVELTISYNTDAFMLSSYSTPGLSGALTSVNTGSAGTVMLNAAMLDGINGDRKILELRFRANESAVPGSYPVSVALGSAYDTNYSPVSLGKQNGTITVASSVPSSHTVNFYGRADKQSAAIGEQVVFTFGSNNTYNLASGKFVASYDEELFEFVSLLPANRLITSTTLYSTNGTNPGQAIMTFASTEPVSRGDLLALTLRLRKNTDAHASVSIEGESLYTADLTSFLGSTRTMSADITAIAEPIDYPDFWIEGPETVDARTGVIELTVWLSGNSKVAAGDFAISYGSSDLLCIEEPSVHCDVAENGGIVITNPYYNAGTIKFSFVNENGFNTDIRLLTIRLKAKENRSFASSISACGTNVVDADSKAVNLEYIPADVSVEPSSEVFISNVSNGIVDSKVILSNSCTSATLIISRYDNGRMTAVFMHEITASGSVQTDLSSGSGEKFKAFLLDGQSSSPLCNSFDYNA